MDLLSHGLVGGLVASIGLHGRYGLVASATMVAASVAPDLDGALAVLGPRYFFQYHRHPLTHSLGGAVLLSAALTAVVCLATPLRRPWPVFGIAFTGMALHLLGDLLTPWPIPLLFPFSSRTYSLDLINFLDPFLLVVLGASFLAAGRWPEKGGMVIAVTFLVAVGYLGFRTYGQQTALRLVVGGSSAAREVSALPHGLSPVAWDVIAREEEAYTHYLVDSLRREVRSSQVVRSTGDRRAVAASRDSDLVQALLRRARFPVAFATEDGGRTTVEWRDVHLMIGGGILQRVTVVLGGRGEIIEEMFGPGTGH